MRALLDSSDDGIAIFDPQGKLIETNSRLSEVWGAPSASLASWSACVVNSEEFSTLFEAVLADPYLEGRREFALRDRRFIEASFRPLHLSAHTVGRIWRFRDITRQKLMERTLRENEERYRILATTAEEGLWLLDEADSTWFVNPKLCEILGYGPEAMVGRKVLDFVDSSQADRVRMALARRRQGVREVMEIDLIRADGATVCCRIAASPMLNPDGSYRGSLGMVTDITEQKNLETELTEARDRLEYLVGERTAFLRSILENIPDMIFVKDARTLRFVEFNRAGELLTGLQREELIGKNDYDFFPPEEADFFTRKDREVLEGQAVVDIPEESIRTRNQGTRILHTKKIPILDKDGKPKYLLGISEDITIQKQIESERAAREVAENDVRVREEFISIASHELRTPLTPLLGQLHLIRKAVSQDFQNFPKEKLQHLLDLSEHDTRRLSRLVENLLDVSRIGMGRLILNRERCNLAELTRQVTHRMQAETLGKKCTLHVDANESVWGTWDPLRVEQVVGNLVMNAIKFGGDHPIHVRVEQDGKHARIRVRDRGPGIPVEAQERIFDRFERASSDRRIGGLGLGLYISRQIARAHGGEIKVASRPGEGSAFTLELPLT